MKRSYHSPIDRLFQSFGRLGRKDYLLHSLLDLVIILGLALLASWASRSSGFELVAIIVLPVLLVTALLGAVVELCATIKRCHDLNLSGWTGFLLLLPLINVIFLLMLACKPGDPHANRYGSPP